SVWCPGHGWVDVDPTNNLLVSVEHVTVAWGRDYGDVSPVSGAVFGGGAHTVQVAVDVLPLDRQESH
ncbi:MAG: transglutaminase family protein, partial [Rhodoplanes sp.]